MKQETLKTIIKELNKAGQDYLIRNKPLDSRHFAHAFRNAFSRMAHSNHKQAQYLADITFESASTVSLLYTQLIRNVLPKLGSNPHGQIITEIVASLSKHDPRFKGKLDKLYDLYDMAERFDDGGGAPTLELEDFTKLLCEVTSTETESEAIFTL